MLLRVCVLLAGTASALRVPTTATGQLTRRGCLAAGLSVAAGAALPLLAKPELAAADDEVVDVYFGCGCFWHVQHEFVEAEKKLLGRGDMEVTSYAGYAGGKAGAKEGKVRSATRPSESVSAVRLHHKLCH